MRSYVIAIVSAWLLGGIVWVLVAAKYSNVSFVSQNCTSSLADLRSLSELYAKDCLSYSELIGEFIPALIWLAFPLSFVVVAIMAAFELIAEKIRLRSNRM
jgi:hypothetical protein